MGGFWVGGLVEEWLGGCIRWVGGWLGEWMGGCVSGLLDK